MSPAARPLIVFLAFANNRLDRASYLRNLPEELRQVREAMAGAVETGLCELIERANATIDEVLDVFQAERCRDRVAIFHFGGHAGSSQLLFESAAGEPTIAHAGGLARFLGERGVELAFLNGCSTRGQVQDLLDAGVSAVIATSQAIDDAVATEFSARFYRSLAAGAPLRTAFSDAQDAVLTRWGTAARELYRASSLAELPDERWPWELYVAPGAEERVTRWSLPLVAGDWLFGLPALPEMDLPPTPFKHLDFFTRQDAAIFFGRGREIHDLYEAVTIPDAPPIVLLFGATGVGKSSLLAAGLAPRLEASHEVVYARRDGARGLVSTLAHALGVQASAGEGAAADLATAWRAREAAAERPLLVALDQVEEAWTRPLSGVREADELAAVLRSIFAVRAKRPCGRLLLGFRKEWLAEVLRLLDKLPRSRIEIQNLGSKAIAEVVAGPASTERLRRQYLLEVEPRLAEEIASNLSEDAGAVIAPTLQILLSKMWAVATHHSVGVPRFTVELYRRLKRNGILLDDFLHEQLLALQEWQREVVVSGLALDVLAYHTTPLGTAETRQLAEVVERYGRRPEVMELLEKHKDRYLLTGTARGEQGELVGAACTGAEKGTTRLAHDTLAPLVRQRFEESNLPGQRASRILAQRSLDWKDGKEGALLDEVDLAIVEYGASGMRAWTADERRLVDESRREQRRRERRRRILLRAVAAGVATVAAAAGVAWWQRGVALVAERIAQDIARVSVAGNWLERDPTRAAGVLLEVSNPEETPYTVAWLRDVLGTRLSTAVLRGHQDRLLGAVFSPDGRRVVTASEDNTARVWTADGSGEPVVLRGHKSDVMSAAFSGDGRSIVTASRDHTARVWAVDGSGEPVVLNHPADLWSATFSPDGGRIVTASSDGTARVWAADGSGEPVVLRGHQETVLSAAFSPDGGHIVTASTDGTARVWAADGSGTVVVLSGHEDTVRNAAFSPDGSRIVTGSTDKTARVWVADGSGVPVVLRGHQGRIMSAGFSPDGQRVVTASSDGTARVWAFDGSSQPLVLRRTGDELWSAAFSPDGRLIVAGCADSTALVWNTYGFDRPTVLRGHTDDVWSAAFSPDGGRVLTASFDGTARVWPVEAFDDPVILRHESSVTTSAVFSPDNRRVVTGSGNEAWVWAADGSGKPVIFRGHSSTVVKVVVGPDSQSIVTASEDGTVRRWEADGSGEGVILRRYRGRVLGLSADGGGLVTASNDYTALVWVAGGSDHPVVLRGHLAEVVGAGFSPDNQRVVTASEDDTARVWATDGSGEPVVLRGHQSDVMSAAFSRDGRRIVTASSDHTARVWAADGSGEPVVLRGHKGQVVDAVFSPDGRHLITASDDGTARVWAADGSSEPTVLRGHDDFLWSAAFSPDGTRAVTASHSKARVWAIEGTALQALVRTATPTCLDSEFRVTHLGEPAREARAKYERCRNCIGPWRHRFDARSVRATPDEAWSQWQDCMDH